MMNNADPLDIDSLKLIDFHKEEDRYNKVSLYFGDTECEDYWGDDWNDTPYEHNAGTVYQEYVKKMEIIKLKNAIILEPSDIPDPNSGWCKRDFKKRTTPCLLVVPEEVVLEYENRFGDYPTYTQAIGHPMVRRIYYGDSYPQVMNTIKYDEVPQRDEPKAEAQKEGQKKRETITNAISLLKWIDHLDEEEKHLPIFIYDDQKRYHGLTSIIHELTAAREDVPPSSHFLINTRRCKTSKEVRYELTHEQPIKEIYAMLQKIIEILEKREELTITESEMYARVNEVMCNLCAYDEIYTKELLHSKD